MEAKGVLTRKGELNRWIRKTNDAVKKIMEKAVKLSAWYQSVSGELKKLKEPTVMLLVSEFYDYRDQVAETFERGVGKAKQKNLQKRAELYHYLEEKNIVRMEELGNAIEEMKPVVDNLKQQMGKRSGRIKELQELLAMAEAYREYQPIYEKSQSIFFKGAKQRYQTEHKKELNQYHKAERILKNTMPKQNLNKMEQQWQTELASLQTEYTKLLEQHKPLKEELSKLEWIKKAADYALEQKKEGDSLASEKKNQARMFPKEKTQEENSQGKKISIKEKLAEKQKAIEEREKEQQENDRKKSQNKEL